MNKRGRVKIGGCEKDDGTWTIAISITTDSGQELDFESLFGVEDETECKKVCMYLWTVFEAKKSGFQYDKDGKL